MIEAVIFDMDGVILDSEPFWQESEIEIFATVGINLSLEKCYETTGLPVQDVVAYRFKEKPWKNKTQKQVSKEIEEGVMKRILLRATPLKGVLYLINYFKNKNIPIALASSSSMMLIKAVLKKLDLQKTFKVVHSAEFEKYGKPHPAVFISTANLLKVNPTSCLVIEDSFNGLIAAKAARMKTIVIPMHAQFKQERFNIADLKLKSLDEFNDKHWKYLNSLN